jgi:hypothetical protein
MKPILIGNIQRLFIAYFAPSSILLSLLQPELRTLVDESGMIRTEMGSTVDQ